MDRIICDICGCEYDETAESCPVCGYPRQGTEKKAVVVSAVVRVKVKGGRFSNKNVKKRHKAQRRAAAPARQRSNKPLLIVIALLLIAIVLVSVYIVRRFFWGSGSAFGSDWQQYLPITTTTAPPVTTTEPTVPCAGILLDTPVIALDAEGQTLKLDAKTMPADTTDVMTFASSDEAVVQVSADGVLTAVGAGQAEITVTCGTVVESCSVVCWFGETTPAETTMPVETTAPTEAPTQPQQTEAAVLTLDPNDASCFSSGERFTIYPRLGTASVSRTEVTWTTSDPKIATVKDGVVTAVAKGTATITAEYEGQKAICMVRCRFENPTDQEGTNQEGTNQEGMGSQDNPSDQNWKASHSDVSIKVGESFRLTVKNDAGEIADAIWTMSIDGVVSIDGRTITGRDSGTVTLTTTVQGNTFTCIVRVR